MLRHLSTALALVGALGCLSITACKKTADSANPEAGSPGGTAPSAGGIVLRYKPAATKLKENLNVSFNLSGGGQTGSMKADLTGLLDISPSGNERLRVGFSMLEVRSFDLSGNMKPEPKDGKPVPDLKAKLLETKGARIVNLLGDSDKDASKALPENAPKKEGTPEDEFDMSSFGSFLGLPPELPKDGLAEGKPVKVSKEEKENFFGGLEIDMETETTYTLVKIDSSSGKRIADIKIESESSGAKELSQGGQTMMLSVDVASESTIVFNLDDMLPVRTHIESTTNFSAGAQGGGESRVVMDASYEPAT
ncbi:MAG: hypothetical protein IPO88_04965 [Nannocystis sp.]|uniref:hypothetical protein n=1 Tax=Nannocystis sp. TaxID=1962667 RepID=UPI002429354A|nr:hypothetical protein [Nannocystis sp.]MBK9752853.1 hypothetical protein [Nannocystis sp.]